MLKGKHPPTNLTTITNVKTYNKNALKFYRFKLTTLDEITTNLQLYIEHAFNYGNMGEGWRRNNLLMNLENVMYK